MESENTSLYRRLAAHIADGAMCIALNALQARGAHRAIPHEEFVAYLDHCERMGAEEYFLAPPPPDLPPSGDGGPAVLVWESPVRSGFSENDRCRAEIFPGPTGWSAPTVFLLHALMSASATGYRRLAAEFNRRGWNAILPHLPFHYDRTPRGFWNGELAVSPELRRTGEGLRQAVIELRQLMAWCRARGGREFALWATSYGAWVGALLGSVEADFRFLNLMTPIVDVEHATWRSAASKSMRVQLRKRGITHLDVARHAHLTSPMHRLPLTSPDRIYLVAGIHDRIADPRDIERLREIWGGPHLLRVEQGHFGYRAAGESFRRIEADGLLAIAPATRHQRLMA